MGRGDTISYFTNKVAIIKVYFFIVINHTQFHDRNLGGANIASTLTTSHILRFGIGDFGNLSIQVQCYFQLPPRCE